MGRQRCAPWWVAGLLVLCMAALRVEAQTPAGLAADELLAREQAAFLKAAELAAASVVQIETFGGLERVGKELVSDGPTTGTVIAEGGWVISSLYNFRQQPASILVSLPGGKRVAARIVARDTSRELVLLKMEESVALPVAIPAPSEQVSVGQWCVAVGRTFERESISQSVGIVSALGRAYGKAIQTDAKVSPVNYGGPLVDLQGRVLGILAPISPGAILEGDSSQLYDSGIGFAVPLADILERLEQLQAGEDIRSGKLGVVVSDQNELLGPVRVTGASPGSPAAKAGLKAGDVIVEAGGRPVTLLAHLRHALGPADAGRPFSFVVERRGERVELSTTLVAEVPTYRLRYLGVEVEADEGAGVRVTRVWPDSPAARAKLPTGARIVACNEVEIREPKDLRDQVAVAELDRKLALSVVETAGGEPGAAGSGQNTGDRNQRGNGEQTPAAAAQARVIEIQPVEWPAKIESPPERAPLAAGAGYKVRELELALGDFPNPAVAWVPERTGGGEDAAGEAAALTPRGLLVLIPEPGEVDRKKFREVWEPLVREGWAVAYFASTDPKRWSLEEVELVGRVISRVEETVPIDPAQTVVGGIGVGARLAIIGARAVKGKASGVLMLAAPLEGARVQRENSPLESLHILAVGPAEGYRDFVQQLQKLGFPALGMPAELTPTNWEALPRREVQDWLRGLGRI
jgi:serine protease Do